MSHEIRIHEWNFIGFAGIVAKPNFTKKTREVQTLFNRAEIVINIVNDVGYIKKLKLTKAMTVRYDRC